MRLPEIYFINLWLLGEEIKPLIIRDADKTLHFVPRATIGNFCTKLPFQMSQEQTFLDGP
jgi:hypothetical protein